MDKVRTQRENFEEAERGRLLFASFLTGRRMNVGQIPWVSGSYPLEVLSGERERQVTVRPAPHHIGVTIRLPIIFPEADRANLVAAPFTERAIAAARALIGWPDR